jgi:integrase
LRCSQLFALRLEDVDFGRSCVRVRFRPNSKSTAELIKPVSGPTLEAIKGIASPQRDQLFDWPGWPRTRRDFFSVFRYLCLLADVPCPRDQHGELTHKLRRTSITVAAMRDLEAARRHAGHTRPETTLRHYIDPRLLALLPPAVPPLADLDTR